MVLRVLITSFIFYTYSYLLHTINTPTDLEPAILGFRKLYEGFRYFHTPKYTNIYVENQELKQQYIESRPAQSPTLSSAGKKQFVGMDHRRSKNKLI